MEQDERTLPPYVPWSAFKSLLQDLRNHLPQKVDRSVLGEGRSGATTRQLQGALRFLKLVNADDTPTDDLRRLVKAGEGDLPGLLSDLLDSRYSPTIRLGDLADITRQQFERKFAELATGSTARKARKFYLEAAKEARAPVSPRLKTRASPTRRNPSKPNGTPTRAKPITGSQQSEHTRSASDGRREIALAVQLLETVLERLRQKPESLEAWLEGMIQAREQLAGHK